MDAHDPAADCLGRITVGAHHRAGRRAHMAYVGFLDIGRHPHRARIMQEGHAIAAQRMFARIEKEFIHHAVDRAADGVLFHDHLLRLDPGFSLGKRGLQDGQVIVDQADFLASDAGCALVCGSCFLVCLRPAQRLRARIEHILRLIEIGLRHQPALEQVPRPVIVAPGGFKIGASGLDTCRRR